MQRAPHGPRLHDRPLLGERAIDRVDGQGSDAGPEGDPCHRGHLSLDSAHVSDDVRELAARCTPVQMVAAHAERRDLRLGETGAIGSGRHGLPMRPTRPPGVNVWAASSRLAGFATDAPRITADNYQQRIY